MFMTAPHDAFAQTKLAGLEFFASSGNAEIDEPISTQSSVPLTVASVTVPGGTVRMLAEGLPVITLVCRGSRLTNECQSLY